MDQSGQIRQVGQRRFDDGSAGDADYGASGSGYARYRQPEPRIAQRILDALGPARLPLADQ